MDIGAGRSIGDQLRVSFPEIRMASLLGAMIPRYNALMAGSGWPVAQAMTKPQIVAWYGDHPHLHARMDSAALISRALNGKLGGSGACVGACILRAMDLDEPAAREFFQDMLLDGQGWEREGNPARTLGQFLAMHKGRSNGKDEMDSLTATQMAWNAWRKGRDLKVLRPRINGVPVQVQMA